MAGSLRAAVAGLGSISPLHLEGIQTAGSQLVAGCDVCGETAAALPKGAAFYTNLAAMLAAEKPDILHIALPHWLHLPAAEQAAKNGIHVFCEKPMGISPREAQRFAALEAEYGVKVGICLQNRLNNTSAALLAALESGEWGAVTAVRGSLAWKRDAAYYAAAPWRGTLKEAGSGVLLNQAIHTLDLMLLFTGSPLDTLRGTTAQLLQLGLEVEDTVAAHLTFQNGATGLFTATVANHCDDPVELSVQCEKGSFTIRSAKLYSPTDEVLASDDGPTLGKACYGNSHAALIARFHEAVAANTGNYISAGDALPAMEAAFALLQSAKTGETIHFN